MNERAQLQEIVDHSRHIVFFGGAGVSTESGIPDFRSAEGLYRQKQRIPPEEILSHRFFMAHPDEFYEFYRHHLLFPQAQPNAAHRKLAELERANRLEAIVTQNIDGLHQAAGSRRVLELHGSVHRNRCMRCGARFGLDAVLHASGVPHCPECGGVIKPEVVLYEEPLDEAVVNEAVAAIAAADTLLIAGTSLAVYPAAGLIRYFRGAHLVLINRDPTPADGAAELVLHAKVGEVLGAVAVR